MFSSKVLRLSTVLILGGIILPVMTCRAYSPDIFASAQSKNRIAIHCSLKVLQVWKDTELVREYPVETGEGGLGKRASGDHRTPIGDYEITWMASKNAEKGRRIVNFRSWCKDNKFLYAESGPRFEKLWSEPYGGDEAAVMSINYPNARESKKGYTGDCIHIHSDKRTKEGMLMKSYGCIHMFPKDANELYEIVNVGTPVKILP